MPYIEGVVISEVENNTPAQVVGLRPGDVVLEVNGEKVSRSREFEKLVANPQRVWRLQISRGGQIMTTTVGG